MYLRRDITPLKGYNLNHIVRKTVLVYTSHKGADEPGHLDRLISAFVGHCKII